MPLLVASPSVSGFIQFGRLATFPLRHEAESGSLPLRLAGSLSRFPPVGRPYWLRFRYMYERATYMVNSFQFTRLSQAYPGLPHEREWCTCKVEVQSRMAVFGGWCCKAPSPAMHPTVFFLAHACAGRAIIPGIPKGSRETD